MEKNKFEGQEYHLTILGKHLQITDAIRNYVLEKLSKIEISLKILKNSPANASRPPIRKQKN